MKKKNFGFTLVEMLVVLAIMGLILIMVFPAVNQLIKRTSNKKYIYHEQAMIEAAKLYLDQYEADVAGIGWTGCVEIDYTTLLNSNLLKKFQDENINCNISGNKVRITKENKKESYQAYLECQDESEKTVYQSSKKISGECRKTVPSSSKSISNVLFDKKRIGSNCSVQKVSELTSLQGNCSNNYVWYSGKLWRVISHNSSNNAVRMITQWNISTIPYGPIDNSNYEQSYVKVWMENFKSTLREYSKFLVYPYIVEPLSKNEYTNFINNGQDSGLKTAYNSTNYDAIHHTSGYDSFNSKDINTGVRPVISLKGNIRIISGRGTMEQPYRLEGDYDKPVEGTLLNTRFSGEYVKFNNELYRIISTDEINKIMKIDYLKEPIEFDTGYSNSFSITSPTNIGYYLNNTWKNTLSNASKSMLTTGNWYLGNVSFGESFRNTTTNCSGSCVVLAEIGLPAIGELFAGQFTDYNQAKSYWTITPFDNSGSDRVNYIYNYGKSYYTWGTLKNYVRPALYLKSTIKIQSGTGLPNDPFILTK